MILLVLMAGIACLRIILTYQVFCQTYDEPAHIAAGMEWLSRGAYTFEVFHPPLARIAVAMGPFLSGLRLHSNDMWKEGNQILYANGTYLHNLALARLGIIPFFLLATFVVFAWSRRLFGDFAAIASVLVFTMLPPVLGHAGVATTDLPVAATCVTALYALVLWLDRPTMGRSISLGLALAIAILSKFTAVLFLAGFGLSLVALQSSWTKHAETKGERPKPRPLAIGLMALVMGLLIWAGYRFSIGTLSPTSSPPQDGGPITLVGSRGRLRDLAVAAVTAMPLPAPEFFVGLLRAAQVNHGQYIFGRVIEGRCWYFFLVDLTLKSPIALLLLDGIGLFCMVKRFPRGSNWQCWAPAVAAFTVILVTLPVEAHGGIRHILVIYPLLSVIAGFGAVALWTAVSNRPALPRATVVLLLGWLVVSSIGAHPDYLPYFNEIAGKHPERILVDSDLDWGQDLLRLGSVLHEHDVQQLSLSYFGTAVPAKHGLPRITPLSPYAPTTGWVAISLHVEEISRIEGQSSWLDHEKPVALVGRSIRLYYIPDSGEASWPLAQPNARQDSSTKFQAPR